MNNRRSNGASGGHSSFHRAQSSYNGPMAIPTAQSNGGRERNDSMGNQQFNAGKSPPNNMASKNTKHVPCKFFRQGQCQAGASCPFSHALGPASEQTPCKFFLKGNCKFGAKCALAHYMPNGQRVDKADLQPLNAINTRSYNDVPPYHSGEQASHDPYMMPKPYSNYVPEFPFLEEEFDPNPDRYAPAFRNGNAYDHPVGSPPTSQFGSPPNDVHSPPQRKWPSALEAPMPPSYTGSVPNYAKVGHVSGSVPDKFGLGSPPTSIFSQAVGSPPNRESLLRPSSNLKPSALGASPVLTESIGERMLHSERHALRSRLPISSSVPVRDLDLRFGIDDLPFLPSGIHDEVLTPSEKMQRTSRPDSETGNGFRDGAEGLAIPQRSSNTTGSPSATAAGSPSRFRALFEEQQKEKNTNMGVGSPLRESWLLDGVGSTSTRPMVNMSGISTALSRMDLNRTESSENQRPSLRTNNSRQISSPALTGKRIDEEGDPSTFFPMDDESTRRIPPAKWNDRQNNAGIDVQFNRIGQGSGGAFLNGGRPVFGGFDE